MPYIISWLALIISVLALLFGGYFNSSWEKQISKPAISLVVKDLKFDFTSESGDNKINIPYELKQKSEKTQYVINLHDRETENNIRKLLDRINTFDRAAIDIQYAIDQLNKDSSNDTDAHNIWEGLSSKDQSAFFEVRTRRLIRTNIEDIGESEKMVIKIINTLNNEQDDTLDENNKHKVSNKPEVIKATDDITKLIESIKTNPTKSLLLETFKDDIAGLKDAATELNSFKEQVNDIINKLDTNKYNSMTWTIDITAINNGGSPDSIKPIGALSIQKTSTENIPIIVRQTKTDNIVVQPGSTVDLTLSSYGIDDGKKNKILHDYFNSEDKYFIIIIPNSNGSYNHSGSYNFSSEINKKIIDKLKSYAESKQLPQNNPR